MGLDITAYTKLTFITADEEMGIALLEGDDGREYVHIHGPDFPERLDGEREGYYRSDGDTSYFPAGSYVSYGSWREWLANQVGTSFWATTHMRWMYPTILRGIRQGDPFYELIQFSDCEGAIGPKTSKKLAADFAVWAERMPFKDPRFENFKKAFELASTGGFVCFH